MTKEPADWAKIKAYRVYYCGSRATPASILMHWPSEAEAVRELARMYDKYEQPPVDPDLLAAQEWLRGTFLNEEIKASVINGNLWYETGIAAFLAGIKHGRANP